MAEGFEHSRAQPSDDRHLGTWRGTVSAWAVVLVFLLLLAAVQAVASLRGAQHPDGHLGGAVIPRHDTACVGPGIPSPHPADGCEATPLGKDRSAYW